MKISIALCLLIASPSLFAQYGPPAKDLDEALFLMKEIQRQLEPAVADALERAVVFKLVGNVQNELIGKEPATEVSDAKRLIDDFLHRREQSARELSRENLATLMSVRKELELAQPPYAILALRERLHHEFVHRLEQTVLRDIQQLERLQREWDVFVVRSVKRAYSEGMSGVAVASKELAQ